VPFARTGLAGLPIDPRAADADTRAVSHLKARRPLSVLLVASFAPAAAMLSTAAAGAPVARPSSASHLSVTQVEYHFQLSQAVVKAGPVDLSEIDAGRQEHDLRLRSLSSGGSTIYGKRLRPRTRWSGVVYLKPGVYKLWCSLPEHEKLGMHTTLRVIR
jgi:hypothetical protein